MLKAVTFDLWQTLIVDTPAGLRRAREERVRGLRAVLETAGIRVDEARVDAAYDAVGVRLEDLWVTRRDLGSRGQVRWLLEEVGLDGRIPSEGAVMDALDEAYCLPILTALPVTNDGAGEVLAALRASGLMLGLICNTGRTPGRMLRQVLHRLGLAAFLTVQQFSDEVGLRKPHPEIFRRTLAALEVAPSEAVHIGDDITTDVAGARGVRMRAVHLRHAGSASQDSEGAEAISNLRMLLQTLGVKVG
jgi:putative hydrolase of the HAD superfamily